MKSSLLLIVIVLLLADAAMATILNLYLDASSALWFSLGIWILVVLPYLHKKMRAV